MLKAGDRIYYFSSSSGSKRYGTVTKIAKDSILGTTLVWAKWEGSGTGWMPLEKVFRDEPEISRHEQELLSGWVYINRDGDILLEPAPGYTAVSWTEGEGL